MKYGDEKLEDQIEDKILENKKHKLTIISFSLSIITLIISIITLILQFIKK